jgi:hypothetical protein
MAFDEHWLTEACVHAGKHLKNQGMHADGLRFAYFYQTVEMAKGRVRVPYSLLLYRK